MKIIGFKDVNYNKFSDEARFIIKYYNLKVWGVVGENRFLIILPSMEILYETDCFADCDECLKDEYYRMVIAEEIVDVING